MASNGKKYNQVQTRIVVKHGKVWRNIEHRKRIEYVEKAEHARADALHAIMEDRKRINDQLGAQRIMLHATSDLDSSIRLQHAKLSKMDMVKFEGVYTSMAALNSADCLASLPSHAHETPAMPIVIQDIIDAVPFAQPTKIRPPWLTLIALNRDAVKNNLFKIEASGAKVYD